MDIHEHVKSGDQMDFLTVIHQMGKFPEFLEFTEMPPTAFAFASSIQTPNPTFPSFNNAADPLPPPCFLPYSASPRWRTHLAYTGTAANSENSMAAMREMMYQIAAMQPIHIDPESVKPPKRRNVKISKDPQSIAARHRRERISQKIRILRRIVPGGTKMDTASMLDEAIHYVKFLKNQLHSLQHTAAAAGRREQS